MNNKVLFLLMFVVCYLYHSPNSFSQIVINEISICNVNGELDPKYDYSGWIELYNSSSSDIELKNVYFSDEVDNPLKYKLSSSRILPAGGFQIVWLNDELINSTTGYFLDTDADDGGVITIADKKGNLYDTFTYEVQYPNVSYGRTIDGDITAPLAHFIDNTFLKSNNGALTSEDVTATPQFSLASGFYSGTQNVEITCETDGAEIYYTIDNSEPTKECFKYNGPITIDSTVVLRAKAFKDGNLKGIIATNTYMINERKPSLPIVFLNTTDGNLYNDTLGIYCIGTNGIVLTATNPKANYNQNWTRWANFELQDEARDIFQNQPVGIAISGNASRGYAQKSFKIKGKSRYGQKRFDFNLFPKREGMRYKSFLLRNGGQYFNAVQLIHDACIQSLCDVTPLDYQESFPVVVYLNGQYWGIYNVRERKNIDMLYSHYGFSETDVDIIEFSYRAVANNGSKTAWTDFENFVNASDFSKDEDYAQVKEKMNIDNYIYYMAVEILIKNTDWPNNNQMMFRGHNGGQWKWVLQDLDNTLQNGNHKNMIQWLKDQNTSLLSTKLLVKLLDNKQFAEQYITTQALVTGSVFAPSRFNSRYSVMKAKIADEYSYYKEKWPEQARNDFNKTTSIIKNEAALCADAYVNLQENFSLGTIHALTISSDLDNVNLSFNDQIIPVLPYEGSWFEDKNLTLKAPLYHNGLKFAYWSITEDSVERNVSGTTLNFLISKDTKIKPVYEVADLVRRAGLYINEVSACNAIFVDNLFKYEDWIEIYNSANYDIDLADYCISNNKEKLNTFRFSANDKASTIVKPGEHKIIWCSKKPERGSLHTNFKLAKEGSSVYLSEVNKDNNVVIVDSLHYMQHSEYASVGRYPDGTVSIVTFDTPTFGSFNKYSTYNVLNYIDNYKLVCDVKPITVIEGEPIVYTTDDNNTLNIEWKDNTNLKILSIKGDVLLFKEGIMQFYSIDISNIHNGLYIIDLESADQHHYLKFIK